MHKSASVYILNYQILDLPLFQVSFDDRAFRYGDGFFDTFFIKNGLIHLEEYHVSRGLNSMQYVYLENRNSELEKVYKFISQLVSDLDIFHARCRLQVWRKPGGLYTTHQKEWNWSVEIHTNFFVKVEFLPGVVGVCKNPYLGVIQQPIKSLMAMPYIRAGFEKQELGLADMILTNTQFEVAETITSNVFMFLNGHWHTPELQSGCIPGTMRQYVIDQFGACDLPLHIKKIHVRDILHLEAAFSTNASGIHIWTQTIHGSINVSKSEDCIKALRLDL